MIIKEVHWSTYCISTTIYLSGLLEILFYYLYKIGPVQHSFGPLYLSRPKIMVRSFFFSIFGPQTNNINFTSNIICTRSRFERHFTDVSVPDRKKHFCTYTQCDCRRVCTLLRMTEHKRLILIKKMWILYN